VRCFDCHHANFAGVDHCAGCGRDLGLEPLYEAGRLTCPACQEPMSRYRGHPGELHDCSSCAGQFLDHELLRQLLDRRQVLGRCSLSRTRKARSVLGEVKYLPCPECRATMNRRNFAGASGIIVDVCHQHGIWFDGGELPAVLSFVESGGLARARAEFREQPLGTPKALLVAGGAATAAASASSSVSTSGAEGTATQEASVAAHAVDVVLELVAWLAKL
jgi:Zn-finger nucleic acid-binding protein